jgi:hypothetical protein
MKLCAALLASLIVLPSCTTQPAADSSEIFDEETAMTELVAATPMVFARERSDVAAHARDYATLVAVEVDRSGEYGEYLLLYRWSTVDRRMSPPPARDAGKLRLFADGREIDLPPLDRLPVNMQQRRALHVPAHGDIVAHAYQVDASLLQFIAASRDLVLRMPQESLDTPFTLWADGRGSLQRFLERAAAP